MSMKFMMTYYDSLPAIRLLSDSERGRLFLSLLEYGNRKNINGYQTPNFPGRESFLFEMLKAQMDRDEEKYQEMCQRNKQNRQKNGKSKGKEIGELLPVVTSRDYKKEKEKEKHKNKKDEKEKNELFEKFWKVYPKKVAKQAAEKAFVKLNPSEATLDDILAGVREWYGTEQWQKNGGQFIPNPATFLNDRRWEDEIPKGGASHGDDESEVGRRARCTEFEHVISTDGSKFSAEELAKIRAENEEFARLG